MWLLVGLGNPEPKYENNRHNIGFMAVDEIVRRHCLSSWQNKFSALISQGIIAEEKVVCIKPQTYMNRSGNAVMQAMQFYKIAPKNLWIFHDELDLKPSQFRLKKGGGHGGHNGLRHISQLIGTDYGRVRMGIGHPGEKHLVSSYVLKDFPKEDQIWVKNMVDAAANHVDLLISGDEANYMNKVNLATRAN